MTSLKRLLLIPLCLTIVALTGCDYLVLGTAGKFGYDYYNGEDINLTAENYAAADYIITQADTFIDRFDLIEAKPLVNMDAPGLSSEFGKTVSAQVGTRLLQLGYRIDLSAVAPEEDVSLHENLEAAKNPRHTLTGTYKKNGRKIDVMLRIVQNSDKRVIGAFEYQLPFNRSVNQLAEPEAQIFITE